MSDDYDERAEKAAKIYAQGTIFEYAKAWDEIETIFQAGVKWARDNPPPEVMELVEALKEVIRNSHDIIAKKNCSEALRRLEGK